MTEKLFYRVFNHNEKITNKNIEILKSELLDLISLLKEKNDVDNLTILNNKIELVIKKNKKKLDKKHKKDLYGSSFNPALYI